jgi:hypothetical protein
MKLEPGIAGPAVAQVTLGVMALMLVAFAPPAQGRMLIVPLDGQLISGSAIHQLHATPLAAGPFPGSWIVDGERRELAGLWSEGIVVLAAPEAICGGAASGGAGNA